MSNLNSEDSEFSDPPVTSDDEESEHEESEHKDAIKQNQQAKVKERLKQLHEEQLEKRESKKKLKSNIKSLKYEINKMSIRELVWDVLAPDIVILEGNQLVFKEKKFPLDIFEPYIYVKQRFGNIVITINNNKRLNKLMGWNNRLTHYGTISESNKLYSNDLMEEINMALLKYAFNALDMVKNRMDVSIGPINIKRYNQKMNLNDEQLEEYYVALKQVYLDHEISHAI